MNTPCSVVRAIRGAESRFASHLTDPPGIPTDYPSLVLHPYGKGKVLYSAGVIETWEHQSQRTVLGKLLRLLLSKPPYFESDAPAVVELTLFNQQESYRYILHLLNFQDQLPNIPVHDIEMTIRLDGKKIHQVICLSDQEEVEFSEEEDRVLFTFPRLETYEAFAVDYR